MKVTNVLLFVLMVSISCNENTPPPPEPDPPTPKNPREYTWTVDTLRYPGSFQTLMYAIWGSSSTSLYVVGHNDLNRGKMYHYDGSIWEPVRLTWSEGGPIEAAIDLSDIFGFGPNDIYSVGDRTYWDPFNQTLSDSILVIHFDGSSWSQVDVGDGRYLQTMAGNSQRRLWTGGTSALGLSYDGISWRRDSIPVTVPEDATFGTYASAMTENGNVYALSSWFQSSTVLTLNFFLRWNPSEGWVTIDSILNGPGLTEEKWGYGSLWCAPWGDLYSTGGGVFRWNGLQWDWIFPTNTALVDITGVAENSIFVSGHFGTLYHFNGENWYQFPDFDSRIVLSAVWTDGNEVFVVGYGGSGFDTYVFHGK